MPSSSHATAEEKSKIPAPCEPQIYSNAKIINSAEKINSAALKIECQNFKAPIPEDIQANSSND